MVLPNFTARREREGDFPPSQPTFLALEERLLFQSEKRKRNVEFRAAAGREYTLDDITAREKYMVWKGGIMII